VRTTLIISLDNGVRPACSQCFPSRDAHPYVDFKAGHREEKSHAQKDLQVAVPQIMRRTFTRYRLTSSTGTTRTSADTTSSMNDAL
jgi:hypothetical protein